MRLNPDPADAVNATRELLTWLGENPVAVAIVGGLLPVVGDDRDEAFSRVSAAWP